MSRLIRRSRPGSRGDSEDVRRQTGIMHVLPVVAAVMLMIFTAQAAQVGALLSTHDAGPGCGCGRSCACRTSTGGTCSCVKGTMSWSAACSCGGTAAPGEAPPPPPALLALPPPVTRTGGGTPIPAESTVRPPRPAGQAPEPPP